jgi:hypothetical protein
MGQAGLNRSSARQTFHGEIMAATMNSDTRQTSETKSNKRQRALTLSVWALAVATTLAAHPATAVGQLGNVDILTRGDGQVLPIYPSGGRNWVVGAPGQEYSIRYCNSSPGRVLAVISVDGVNVVSGDTASPAQSGYVLNANECSDIHGWRKNLARTAAFYFTELPDAYATRTGRPENVGVIGVAVFREKQHPVMWRPYNKDKVAGEARSDSPVEKRAAQSPAAGGFAQDAQSSADSARSREDVAGRLESAQAQSMPAPAPMSKLGTGHGRSEDSPAQMVRFERESASPNETIAIYYDRRENLVAMGILQPPSIARSANPFPGWPRFVPDPPNR